MKHQALCKAIRELAPPKSSPQLQVPTLGLVLNCEYSELRIEGVLISCPPRALRILAALLNRPSQILSRNELIKQAWDGIHVGESSLHESISLLRRSIAAIDPTRSVLETIRGRGYQWNAPVIHDSYDGPSSASPTRNKADAASPSGSLTEIEYGRRIGWDCDGKDFC
jgi:DNA-binding winged helix-turn-helix (wHTH) protein